MFHTDGTLTEQSVALTAFASFGIKKRETWTGVASERPIQPSRSNTVPSDATTSLPGESGYTSFPQLEETPPATVNPVDDASTSVWGYEEFPRFKETPTTPTDPSVGQDSCFTSASPSTKKPSGLVHVGDLSVSPDEAAMWRKMITEVRNLQAV